MSWTGLLHPWADHIKKGKPLPEHVVALLLASLKLQRTYRKFHKDNYVDLRNYAGFAEKWQAQHARAQKPA